MLDTHRLPDSPADPAVTGVALSSTGVRPGDLYAALPGARTHGARFSPDAVSAGAVAVLTDEAGRAAAAAAGVPVLVVERPRHRLGEVARAVYGDPGSAMLTLGVTGTQGKTTTTALMGSALRATGRAAGVVGTLGTSVDGRAVRSALTTPEAPDLHALFAVMREQGVDACAMEVSSHALVQRRVDGVVFDVAVFLNLGRDHLDFHADLEDYFAAKAQLFTAERARQAVIDIDDAHGAGSLPPRELAVTTVAVDRSGGLAGGGTYAPSLMRSTYTVVAPDGASQPASGVPAGVRSTCETRLPRLGRAGPS
jgi:UDP-N-acetylmuramoyl-L-alanyl-D-glutamate--2,6-diaminopimelate ligase